MTKLERDGLERILRVNMPMTEHVEAGRAWIRRQLEIDEKRRRKRGKYRRLGALPRGWSPP